MQKLPKWEVPPRQKSSGQVPRVLPQLLLKMNLNNKLHVEGRSSDIWTQSGWAERGGPGRWLYNENVLPIKLKGEQPRCPHNCMWHWLLESLGY